MAHHHFTYFLFVLLFFTLDQIQSQTTVVDDDPQESFFVLAKKTLLGNALSSWHAMGDSSYCNYTGISCNNEGQVIKINISGSSISGYFPPSICSYLPNLQIFDISKNKIYGGFPISIINCRLLEVLNMSALHLTGKLPNFSTMKSLKALDLSYNMFEGDFPISIINLTALEVIHFNENHLLNPWELPNNISNLKSLKSLVLSTCTIYGKIPSSIGNMTSLVDLQLAGNYLQGQIPLEIGRLKNLKQLMLYYNRLTGNIPEELGNLTQLTDIDISVNLLSGKIPEKLCSLPKLEGIQLYDNNLTGEIPEILGESTTLKYLSIYDNKLSGEVPRNLGRFSPLVLIDLSENQLSDNLPPYVCTSGKLLYFLVLENMFTGQIPQSYANCTALLRFRVSYNELDGPVPEKLLSLPHVSIIDLGFNHFNGSIPRDIGNPRNLSELFLQSNRISGLLPPEIARAVNLVKIDLSDNLLSGPLPSELGSMKKLNLLLLQGNNFSSSIPDSLSLLRSLNLLDLSNNQLTGEIPESLSALLPNSMNLSYNHLWGPIPAPFINQRQEESFIGNPQLCVTSYLNSSHKLFPLCLQEKPHKKATNIWIVVVLLVAVFLGTVLSLKRCLSKKTAITKQDDTLSSTFCSYEMKSFHRISFDLREILESMSDDNIIGHGGSGTVYRVGLRSGEIVAVKKLWSQMTKYSASDEQNIPNKELQTEVETLGSIRHKNIVKLFSCFSSWDCHLLVYEYMPNGNLWDALHKGKNLLDWPTRRQIALGIAQGLAYLHHDLLPPIIHRDIKTSNILLDADYQPKVADFGVAKAIQGCGGKESSNTIIAGTYGYLDPDYANSSKATTKCDVYSFGVVLMELVTGKKPVEAEFGENKNIINWLSTKMETREGATQVLDKRLSGLFINEMLPLLRIAMRCTARAPACRPTMNEVVQLLIEADPCRFNSFKLKDNAAANDNIQK
ncbi:hypothetical protein V2J09_017183 [Rumex salicifolius]